MIRYLFIFAIMIIAELGCYFGLKHTFLKSNGHRKNFNLIYWGITGIILLYAIVHMLLTGKPENDYLRYRTYFIIFSVLVIFYLPKVISSVFFILDDLLHLLIIIVRGRNRTRIPAKKFLYSHRYLSLTGAFAGVFVLIITFYGVVFEKNNPRIHKEDISIKNLPTSFEGFTIIQISDLHLGSFFSEKTVRTALEEIGSINPDILVFTGDMINMSDNETSAYLSMFEKLKPTYGKYSVLGNHDLGDFMRGEMPSDQKDITERLVAAEKNMGYVVLRDTAVFIHKGNDSICICGIDNWGNPPFTKYGNIEKAMKKVNPSGITILLSHDPTIWNEQIKDKLPIALTLSGHTHAMQLGFDYFGVRWSPVKIRYPNYLGLYNDGERFLYVNPGLGYIGFAGRIGVPPEITLFTLNRAN